MQKQFLHHPEASVFHIFFTIHVPRMAFGENTKDLRLIPHRYNAEYQGGRTALKSLKLPLLSNLFCLS